MALISQEALLGMLIPDVYIDGITLESSGTPAIVDNPHIDDDREIESKMAFQEAMDNRTLRVSVDISLKERLDNDLIGTWFREQEFHKYLKIQVFQTTHPGLIKIFSYSQNMINFATTGIDEGHWTSEEINLFIDACGSWQKAVAAVLNPNLFQTRTLSVSADVIGDNSDLTQISSSVDENGVSIHDFTYRAVYELSELNPKELGIFAVSYLDLGALKEDYDLEFDVGTLDSQNGKVASESVIKKGSVVSSSYVFINPDGEVWTGPVHKVGQNSYATGSDPSSASAVKLKRRRVPNDKVQDFRDVAEIMKYSLDVSAISQTIGTINTSGLLGNDRDFMDYKHPYFSDLWLSRDMDGASRFMFAFDMRAFLRHNSIYGNLLNRINPAIRAQVLNSASVRSMTVLRRRVKDVKTLNKLGSIATGQVLFDKQQPYTSLILTADSGNNKLVEKSDTVAAVREADLVISSSHYDRGVHYYTAQDKSMSLVTDGLYQYGVRVEIEDGIVDFLRSVTSDLIEMREEIKLYLDYASRLGMTKVLQEISDPHIDHESERASSIFQNSGHYDPIKNRFTQRFADFLDQQYNDPLAPFYQKRPWIEASVIYANALGIISQDAESAMTQQGVDIADKISVFMSPVSGTPIGIISVLNLFEHLISKYKSLTGDDYRNRGRASMSPGSSSTSSSVSTGENRPGTLIPHEHFFVNNFFDSNIPKSSGLDYLTNMTMRQDKQRKLGQAMVMSEYQQVIYGNSQTRGLKIVDGGYWTQRINAETSKFFTDVSPNLNISFGQDIITRGDSIGNTSFGFLSPSYVVANDKAYAMGLEQQPEYYVNIEAELLSVNFNTAPVLPDSTSTTSQSDSEKIYQSSLQSIYSDLNVTIQSTSTALPVPQVFTGLYETEELSQCTQQQLQAVDPHPAWIVDDENNIVPINQGESEIAIGIASSNYVDFFRKISDVLVDGNIVAGNMASDNVAVTTADLDVTVSGNVFSRLKEDGQLVNSIAISNGLVGDATVSSCIMSLPNQIKSLVLAPIQPTLPRFKWSTLGINPFTDWLYSSQFNLNYQFLASVERFDGFEYVTVSDSEVSQISVKKERWTPLTEQFFVSSAGEEILCRLTPYACESLGIKMKEGIETPVYDSYFLIIPPASLATSTSNTTLIDSLRGKLELKWNKSSQGYKQFASTILLTK